MKRYILLVLVVLLLLLISSCTDQQVDSKSDKLVAVSIIPEQTFVKAIAGEGVNIITMIPPGYSPANYQPSPDEMIKLSDASVYFSVGVPAEKDILNDLLDINKNIRIVELHSVTEDKYPLMYFDNNETKRDPHVWMSPKRVVLMVQRIRDELIKIDPGNVQRYKSNAKSYINKLEQLDIDIKRKLEGISYKDFMIYHPSLGYFANDYNLNMITVEKHGKAATPKDLEGIVKMAEEKDIKAILYQAEFDSSQAEVLANEIGAKTVEVAPLDESYIDNMLYIASELSELLK